MRKCEIFIVSKNLVRVMLSKHSYELVAKVIGAKFETPKTFEQDIALQNLTPQLETVKEFMTASGRTEIISFLNKLKKLVTEHVSGLAQYTSFDDDKCVTETKRMLSELPPNRKKSFERLEDCGFHYVSIDMASANFASLCIICGIQDLSWPEFLKSIVPSDERGNSSKNKKLGIVGQSTPIPDIFYTSKFVRTFVLSDLKKLSHVWEYETLMLGTHIRDLLANHVFCWKSDEIVIRLGAESDPIVGKVREATKRFRISEYYLTNNVKLGKHCLCKQFTDGTQKLIHGHPKMYLDSLRQQ
jgi:hypothetical protein